ncbi:MAG: hypothetical protein R2713_06030 [Ilumatobacteraceae bacterium]
MALRHWCRAPPTCPSPLRHHGVLRVGLATGLAMGLAMGLAVVPVVAGCAATRTVEPADEEIVVATLPPRTRPAAHWHVPNAGVVDVLAAGAPRRGARR